LAELAGPLGSVLALEIDSKIAEWAQENLMLWHQVHVLPTDGSDFDLDLVGFIVASAGVSDLPRSWIDRLNPGGRILVPLAAQSSTESNMTQGWMLSVTRIGDAYSARFINFASFYACISTQNQSASERLLAAIGQGDEKRVRSLRNDGHKREPECWLHGEN